MGRPTTHGLSWASTDRPPITAWAMMPSPTAKASPGTNGRTASARSARRAARKVASEMAISTKVSSRLPNST